MSKTSEWLKEHPKGVTFKCSCGATVNMKAWTEKMGEDFEVLHMYARCWKCDKELDRYQETMLVEMAICDVIGSVVKEFQEEFNCDRKQRTIHVIK